MFATMEDVLSELHGADTNEQGLPPGFRFHPTDEELITFYLASKVFNGAFCGVDIAELDLNRCEPWELPDIAKMGEREWYFFSQRDRKYPTGLRTNRATEAGYWKATGKDREVYSASNGTLLGMKKTLVFYKGRAPRGVKTKWVMHEYRLEGDFSSFTNFCKDEWVLCRILHKTALERKFPVFQTQSYLQQLLSSPSTFFPGMSETQTTLPSLQNSLLTKQETDFKSLLYPCSFPSQSFASSFQSPATVDTSFSPIMLKTLLSHHQEPTVAKHPKNDTSSSHFQPLDGSFYCLDKPQQNLWQEPLSFEVNCSGGLGFTAEVDTLHDMSAYNRSAFQMVLDPPIIR